MITLTPQGRSLLKRVCKAITRDAKSFDMGDWFSYSPDAKCGTAACIAGHVVLQAGFKPPVRYSSVWYRMPSNLVERAKTIFQRVRRARMKAFGHGEVGVSNLAAELLTGHYRADLDGLFLTSNWPPPFGSQYYAAAGDETKQAEIAVRRIKHLLETGK